MDDLIGSLRNSAVDNVLVGLGEFCRWHLRRRVLIGGLGGSVGDGGGGFVPGSYTPGLRVVEVYTPAVSSKVGGYPLLAFVEKASGRVRDGQAVKSSGTGANEFLRLDGRDR
jgi:hypothetical protein